MERRKFIKNAGLAMAALPWFEIPASMKGNSMGIVVHSYGIRWNSKAESKNYPGFKNALDMLHHCREIGAGGMQVMVRGWEKDFTQKIRDQREKYGLYLEGSISLPKTPAEIPAFETDILNAREAGASVIRTVCLSGRRYETFQSEEEFNVFRTNAINSLQWAEPVMRKNRMKLAVENHKDWLAPELAGIIKQLSSEWIGVTLDFGNSVALLEEPMEVIKTLAPYVMSTHVKDMGVQEYEDGFLLSEVPLGKGILDLAEIIRICRQSNPGVRFSLEMITRDPLEIPCLLDDYWPTFPDVRGKKMAQVLRMVRNKKYEGVLPAVSQLSPEGKLKAEEDNVLACLDFSKTALGLN